MIKIDNIRTANFNEEGVFVNNVFYAYADYSKEFMDELMRRIRKASEKNLYRK